MGLFSFFQSGAKYFDKKIDPKCDYCMYGKRTKDGNRVLCEKRGLVEQNYSCKAFIYSPLKRIPVKQLRFVGSIADDELFIASKGDIAEKQETQEKTETKNEKKNEKKSSPVNKAPENNQAQTDKAPEAKPVQADNAPETKPVQADKAPEAKPVQADKAPETKPVQADNAPETKPVQADKAPETKPVQADKVPETKPVQVNNAPETKPVQAKNAAPMPKAPAEAPKKEVIKAEQKAAAPVSTEKKTPSVPNMAGLKVEGKKAE